MGYALPLAGRGRMAAAVGLYVAVFYLAAAAQTALENGSLAAFPGHGLPRPLLAAVVAFLGGVTSGFTKADRYLALAVLKGYGLVTTVLLVLFSPSERS